MHKDLDPGSGTAGDFRLEIAPQGWQLACRPEQTLLLAALAAGVRLPHSCRNGTCRACMSQLTQGRIRYRIEWPGLSAEEKAQGWILPCVAYACEGPLQLQAPQAQALAPREAPPGTLSPPAVDKSVNSTRMADASD